MEELVQKIKERISNQQIKTEIKLKLRTNDFQNNTDNQNIQCKIIDILNIYNNYVNPCQSCQNQLLQDKEIKLQQNQTSNKINRKPSSQQEAIEEEINLQQQENVNQNEIEMQIENIQFQQNIENQQQQLQLQQQVIIEQNQNEQIQNEQINQQQYEEEDEEEINQQQEEEFINNNDEDYGDSDDVSEEEEEEEEEEEISEEEENSNESISLFQQDLQDQQDSYATLDSNNLQYQLQKTVKNKLCYNCTLSNKEDYFQYSILSLLFNEHLKSEIGLDIQVDAQLEKIYKFCTLEKGVCGKILKSNSIGFKCLDCEKDNTCIICQECFENGMHKGHRVYIQQGCSGICDCGDPEAWKQEGFCTRHKGFANENDLNLNLIPQDFSIRFQQIFEELFYQLIAMAENELLEKQNTEIRANNNLSAIFDLILNQLQRVSGQNILLQFLSLKVLMSTFQNKKYFHHDCQNLDGFQATQNKNFGCSCTVLEMLFRMNFFLNNRSQKKLEEYFIQMFSFYQFKQYLILTYTKMFKFLILKPESFQNYKQNFELSKLMDVNVQIFTSDELAILAINSPYYIFILDSCYEILKKGIINKNLNQSIFVSVFYHVKYSLIKPGPQEQFIMREQILEKLFDILYLLQFQFKQQIKSQMEFYDNDLEDSYKYLNLEIHVQDIIRKIIARICVSKDLQQQKQRILGTILRILIKNINNQENENKNEDFSSIQIPLHRSFIITLYSFLDFEIQNIFEQNFRGLLFSFIGLSEEQFHDFLLKNIIYPLKSYGFCREIERKIWVFNGQQINSVAQYYFRSKARFHNIDTIFLQLAVCELSKNLNKKFDLFQIFYKNFSQQEPWLELFAKNNEDDDNNNDKKIQAEINLFQKQNQNCEKFLYLLGDFYSMICYLSVDEISQYNVCMEIFKDEPQVFERFQPRAKNALIGYMQQNQGTDMKTLKEKLMDNFFQNKTPLDILVQDVANFDKAKKIFKLKNEFHSDNNFDQYVFYSDQKVYFEYTDYLSTKFKKNIQKSHQAILGNNEGKTLQRQKLIVNIADNILSSECLFFLKQFMKSEILNKQEMKSHIQKGIFNNMFQPFLKLIDLKLEFALQAEYNQIKEINIVLKEIKKLEGISDLTSSAINYLLKRVHQMNANIQQQQRTMIFEIEQNENTSLIQDQKDTGSSEDTISNKQITQKEAAKKKQQELLKAFQKKANNFSQQNEKAISDQQEENMTIVDENEQHNCAICKDKLQENRNYGIAGYATFSNIYNLTQYRLYCNKIQQQMEDQTQFQDIENPVWELSQENIVYSSCYHLFHFDCFNKFQDRKQKQNNQQYECNCPLCNRLSNIFISHISPNNIGILKTITQNDLIDFHQKDEHCNDQQNDGLMQIENTVINFDYQREKQQKKETIETQLTHQFQEDFIKSCIEKQKIQQLSEIELKLEIEQNNQNQQIQCEKNNYKIEIQEEFTQILQIFINQEFLIQNKDFSKLGIGFSQVRIPVNVNNFSDQFINRLLIISLDSTFINNDFNIIEVIENSLFQALKNIDLQGMQEFKNKQILIYKNVYLNLLISFQQYQSEEKEEFLKTRFQFLQQFIGSLDSSKGENKILFQDLENLMMRMYVYMGVYFFRDEYALIEHKLLAIILIAKLKQIQVKFGEDSKQINLDLCFQNTKFIKLLLPLLRKYFAFKAISNNIDESVMKTLDSFNFLNDYDNNQKEEFQQLLYLCNLSEEKLKKYYKKNQNWIDQWKNEDLKYNFNVVCKLEAELKLKFIDIEDRFGDFYNRYMQVKCVLCKDFPKYGELCICLLCGVSICSQRCTANKINDQGNLNYHACKQHCQTSVFLGVNDSQLIIVKSPKNQLIKCTYFDQFGQPFQKNSKNWNDYQIDQELFKKIKNMIIQDSLAQEIGYMEIKSSIIYRENVF